MEREIAQTTSDGIDLYGKVNCPDEPKGVVVIVHGLCEHQGRYDYLTERLERNGYAVYRFDHRGHGRSGGKRVYYADNMTIVEDTDLFVTQALADHPDLPAFMLGHSMGGFATAEYGTAHPGKLAGYVLSGAWTRDNGKLGENAVAQTEGLPGDTYIPNELGDGVCSDPEVGKRYMADPLVEKKMAVELFRSIHKGHAWLKENAANFVDPCIILHGGADGLVSPKDSLQFFDEIGSTDKSLRIYAGLCHEVFNEYKKDRVIRDAMEWLDDHVC